MGRRGWFVTLSVVLALAAGLLTPRLLAGPDSFQPRRIGPLPEAGLAPRSHHSAVWTGTQMIIWGGDDGRRTFGDGAAYDPARKTWTRLPAAPLQPRSHHSAVWTGQEMIIWGGTATPTRIRTAPASTAPPTTPPPASGAPSPGRRTGPPGSTPGRRPSPDMSRSPPAPRSSSTTWPPTGGAPSPRTGTSTT
nr:hypothetical protein GCM10020093_080330 [Planobispora longispora]